AEATATVKYEPAAQARVFAPYPCLRCGLSHRLFAARHFGALFLDDAIELARVDGFDKVITKSGAAATLDVLGVAVARYGHHLALRTDLAQLGAQLVAVLARQSQIDQRHFRIQFTGDCQSLVRMVGDANNVPLHPQEHRLAVGGVAIVIHHENSARRSGHGSLLVMKLRAEATYNGPRCRWRFQGRPSQSSPCVTSTTLRAPAYRRRPAAWASCLPKCGQPRAALPCQ